MTLAYRNRDVPTRAHSLLDHFSLEMTGKDVDGLRAAAAAGAIPPLTPINITYLGTEDHEARIAAARAVGQLGLLPVAHIAARRLTDEADLRRYLDGLRAAGASERVFVVGGDPRHPHGPFPDALTVIESGVLEDYGVRSVAIAGYPEGHPDIGEDTLWQALGDKARVLSERGLESTVITQFGFDPAPVLTWVAAARAHGLAMPIRIGMAGPTNVRRLLGYARRFGVGTGAEVVHKYGLSLRNLVGSAGPETFLHGLADGYHPARHGELAAHLYAFGGLEQTAEWITGFRGEPNES